MSKTNNEKHYPGTALNATGGGKVTPAIEKQYTRKLNNNPRNDQ